MESIVFHTEDLNKIFGKDRNNLKKIEQALNMSINILTNETKDLVTITAESKSKTSEAGFNEYIAVKAMEALKLGFNINSALLLKDTDYEFRTIDIKSRIRASRVDTIKGRLIGTKGRTKMTIKKLSDCDIVISDNMVGMLGKTENVNLANYAIEAIIRGAPITRIYSALERNRAKFEEQKQEEIEIK